MYLSGTQTRLMSQIMQVLAEPHQEHEIRQQVGELIMQLMQAQFYASFVWNANCNAFMDTVQINMDPSNIADYEAYFQFNDPITSIMQRYQVAVRASDVLPQYELMQTEFFNDFLGKDGLHWGVNLYAWHRGHNIGDMRIWRDKRRDNFSDDEMRLLDMILPAFTASLSRARANCRWRKAPPWAWATKKSPASWAFHRPRCAPTLIRPSRNWASTTAAFWPAPWVCTSAKHPPFAG